MAELRHGCDLVREAYVGSTGKAADRRDPLYNAALQHDDHRTRQKLEKGWQQGMMQGVRMTCAAREMAAALQASTESQESIVGTSHIDVNAEEEAPAALTLTSSIDIDNDDGIQVQPEDEGREGVDIIGFFDDSCDIGVALVESDDEYDDDDDNQMRSPIYPTLTWARKERRAHMTAMMARATTWR